MFKHLGWIGFFVLTGCGGGGGGASTSACSLIDGTVVETSESGCATYLGTFHPGQSASDVAPSVPTQPSLKAFSEATELVLRESHGIYLKTVGVLGREFWNLNGADPEYTGALMGKDGAALSNESPLLVEPFLKHYRIVQLGALLIRAADAATDLTTSQASGLKGYARTLQAYALLLVFSRQFTKGILPVTSLDAPSPSNFLGLAASLGHISDLLNDGATDLTNAGSSFLFTLTPGFSDFDTPSTFRRFNRALYARVRLYANDKAGAISGIAGSFFNINGAMTIGPRLFYDTAVPNPMYFEPDADLFTVHPDFLNDAVSGDINVGAKSTPYMSAVTHDGLTGDTQVDLFSSTHDQLPIIRNEELILIYAEAQIGSNVNESLAAINRVRIASGLGNYIGATNDASMLNEVIARRRYSFFGEGHRWVDLRRTGKFGQLNIDRPGDVAHQELPRPSAAVLDRISLP